MGRMAKRLLVSFLAVLLPFWMMSCSTLTERQGPEGEQGPQGEKGEQGEHGHMSLVVVGTEQPGPNCPAGGQVIRNGIDYNRNESLDDEEVVQTKYICNGETGPIGPQGEQGPQGQQGETGPAKVKLSLVQDVDHSVTGVNWVEILEPGIQFDLVDNANAELRAFGSVIGYGGSKEYVSCGLRFVLDGVPTSDDTWGELIVTSVIIPGTNGFFWAPWYIERDIELQPGTHTVQVEMRASNSDVACCTKSDDFSATRMYVEFW